MPRISVITPIYNAQEYLPACLDSILAQSDADFELILVDDGSSDGSPALCGDYAARDKRIKLIRQAHAGVSAARNAGLAAASGKFLSFVDADDTISPAFFETLLAAMAKCKGDMALCSYSWMDESGGTITQPEKVRDGCMNSDSALTKLFFHDAAKPVTAYTSACNKIYRRALFEGITFPEGRIFEDYAIMYRLMAKATAVAAVAEPLYQRRRHSGSIMATDSPEGFYDKLAADSELIEFVRQDEYIFLLPFALQSFWSNYVHNQTLYLSPGENKAKAKQAQKLLQQHLNLMAQHTTFTSAERRRMKLFAYTPWLARPKA